MGWFRDEHPEHEGYPVAYVVRDGCQPDSHLFRELGYPGDNTTRLDVRRVGAGCTCGWRSPYLDERGTWYPYSVELVREQVEAWIRQLWQDHLSEVERAASKASSGGSR